MDDPYHRLRSVVDGDARIVKKSFAVVIESGTAEGEERRDANARAIVIAIVIVNEAEIVSVTSYAYAEYHQSWCYYSVLHCSSLSSLAQSFCVLMANTATSWLEAAKKNSRSR